LKYNSKLIGILVMCNKDIRSMKDVENIEEISMVCVTASIAISNARLYEKAKSEAQMDAVTSVFNHRYFMDKLISVTSERKRGTTAVCLVGIDMFTVYNDIYGHYAGDAALIKIADVLKQVCGAYGVVSRYAGDIFSVVLPFMDTKQSYEMMEKIRSRIEGMSMCQEDEPARYITVSIGISIFPNQSKDDKELLKHTTLALSDAKKTGRNKTVIYNAEMEEVGYGKSDTDENQMATIYALTAAIDAKDHFTFGHSQRVAKYATAIAEAVGAKTEEIEIIRQASLLHDIGKIGIPENVLTKLTRLTTEEYETMKKHVDLSITIIKYLPTFNKVIPSVIGHHERWDGKGYPRKIKGENISFGARCICIADAFDAITSDRHYKSYMSVEYALDEISRNAGTQFDPALADVFVRLVKDGLLIIEPTRNNHYAKSSNFEQTIS
jgi:diguanylate cyclase (GGDEF)-like protein/putative nucleotidyltransferase with HDIG domain